MGAPTTATALARRVRPDSLRHAWADVGFHPWGKERRDRCDPLGDEIPHLPCVSGVRTGHGIRAQVEPVHRAVHPELTQQRFVREDPGHAEEPIAHPCFPTAEQD